MNTSNSIVGQRPLKGNSICIHSHMNNSSQHFAPFIRKAHELQILLKTSQRVAININWASSMGNMLTNLYMNGMFICVKLV